MTSMWVSIPFGPIEGVSSFGVVIPWDITRVLCLHECVYHVSHRM